jgi:transcriptional regulator with XRE-family HTH domain
VDFPLLIRQRLKELGIGQKELAAAAQVTESYVSQLLTGKKSPPAPERTDVYERMEVLLKLPAGQLAALADLQRKDVLKRKLVDPPAPLFKEVRELILQKCALNAEKAIRSIFEKEPFGALERLITQKLLDVVKRVTRQELDDEGWLRLLARLSDRSYEELRVIVLEFLETDIFTISADNCVTFLDPLIESWNIDLATFAMEIVLNRRFAPEHLKKIEFVERERTATRGAEPGFQAFLQDSSLSGDVTAEEIEFLKALKFARNHPTPLYYYRELQNLRDPLHFRRASIGEEGA